eukprot:6072373-Amphidinium_carterae.1
MVAACGQSAQRDDIHHHSYCNPISEVDSVIRGINGSCSTRRCIMQWKHSLGSRLSLRQLGCPCKHLEKLYSNFHIQHVCCNAWFKDLDEAVPEAKMPHLADVTRVGAPPYADQFASQLQQTCALRYPWGCPKFGELVATWRMVPKDDRPSTEPRGTLGKLLRINYFGDGKTWILNERNAIEAGLKPVRMDPNVFCLQQNWQRYFNHIYLAIRLNPVTQF